MNRYLIAGSGLLLGLNEIRMLMAAHWIVVNNTWIIVDFFMMSLFILSGIINKKNVYSVVLVFCLFIFLLAAVGFYNIYFRKDNLLTLFSFVRPVLLLVALYGMLKSQKDYNLPVNS